MIFFKSLSGDSGLFILSGIYFINKIAVPIVNIIIQGDLHNEKFTYNNTNIIITFVR